MKKSAVLAGMVMVLFFVCGMVSPCWAGFKMEINEQTRGEIGIWMQTMYQWVEDGKINGDQYEDLNDFMIRRAYMYLKGDVTKYVSFFTHVASDKVGMEKPSSDTLRLMWSNSLSCRNAARKPMGTPISAPMATPHSSSSRVIGMRSRISCSTERLLIQERPISPWKTFSM